MESTSNPEVFIDIRHGDGKLHVSISEARDLKVTCGSVYAKSVISQGGTSTSHVKGESKEGMEQVTQPVRCSSNPFFEETLTVSVLNFFSTCKTFYYD